MQGGWVMTRGVVSWDSEVVRRTSSRAAQGRSLPCNGRGGGAWVRFCASGAQCDEERGTGGPGGSPGLLKGEGRGDARHGHGHRDEQRGHSAAPLAASHGIPRTPCASHAPTYIKKMCVKTGSAQGAQGGAGGSSLRALASQCCERWMRSCLSANQRAQHTENRLGPRTPAWMRQQGPHTPHGSAHMHRLHRWRTQTAPPESGWEGKAPFHAPNKSNQKEGGFWGAARPSPPLPTRHALSRGVD